MAIQGVYAGIRVTKLNNIGADATPNRVVVLDSADPDGFDLPSGAGVVGFGVLLIDMRYESGVTPDTKSGSIQISGVKDIECGGAISAWHYVKIKDTTGVIVDAGAVDSMSDGSTQTNVVGIALEVGEDGSLASIWLNPQTLFLA